MPYTPVEDFKAGLDLRRPAIASPAGTLRIGQNVHITRGGDIEVRRSLAPIDGSLAPSTFGLHELNGELWSFGSIAYSEDTFGDGLRYQRLNPPNSAEMTEVLAVDNFDGKIYVIAKFDDGSIFHFYDGVVVDFWSSVFGESLSVSDVAALLRAEIEKSSDYSVTSSNNGSVLVVEGPAGLDFTSFASITPPGASALSKSVLQTPIAATSGTKATWSCVFVSRYTSNNGYDLTRLNVLLGGSSKVDLINADASVGGGISSGNSGQVHWDKGQSGASFAARVANRINEHTSAGRNHGFVADVSGGNLTVTAAVAGANTYAVEIGFVGIRVTLNHNPSLAFSGGVNGVQARSKKVRFTFLGDFLPNSDYAITLNGQAYLGSIAIGEAGELVRVFKSKVYSGSGSSLYFSAIADPTTFDGDENGSGVINVADQGAGSNDIIAIGSYQSRLAFFQPRSIQVWQIEVNEENNRLVQTLNQIGTIARDTVIEFGGIDTFFLDAAGIRSLRVRDNFDSAFAEDIGGPIDDLVTADVRAAGPVATSKAFSVIEPTSGRLWLILGSKAYVLSYFPNARVQAWSTYEFGFTPTAAASINNQLHLRDADGVVYAYGGAGGADPMPSSEGETIVRMPFMSFRRPAHIKADLGFDCSIEGTWQVNLLVDPRNIALSSAVGTFDGETYDLGRINIPGRFNHCAIEMRRVGDEYATISGYAIHYDVGEKS